MKALPLPPVIRAALILVFVHFIHNNAWSQSLSGPEIQSLTSKIASSAKDTAQVTRLLRLADHYIESISRPSAQDSALRLSRQSRQWSESIKYDSGVIKGYLAEIRTLIAIREAEIKQTGNEQVSSNKEDEVLQQLIAYVKKSKSLMREGEVYSAVADCYPYVFYNLPKLISLYDSSVAIFTKVGDKKRLSKELYHLGFMHNSMGHIKESQQLYRQSLALADSTDLRHLQVVNGTLGNTYTFQGNNNLGLKYQLLALKIAETRKDTTSACGLIHLFLGLNYEGLKDIDKALYHFRQAVDRYTYYASSHPGDFASCASNYAKMLIKKKPADAIAFMDQFLKKHSDLFTRESKVVFLIRYMQAYMFLKQYDKAQIYCDQIEAFIKDTPNRTNMPFYIAVTQFYAVSKQFSKARKYLPIAQRLAEMSKSKRNIRDIYLFWHKVDSAQGNYHAALINYTRYKLYNDSLLDDNKAKEIAELEVSYETDKKEQSIALLTKEAELKEEQLKQSRWMRNTTLAGTALLFIVLALVYSQYRAKQKTNQVLLGQQAVINSKNKALQHLVDEKEWLLKEIHHRVKNNLQTVVSLLESQSAYIQNNEALSAIQDGQNRVNAMSLIHQKLYQSDGVASINMKAYLFELVHCLSDSFNQGKMSRIDIDVDDIELDVSQSIPVGLILNEAVTNAFKYAFAQDQKDKTITIRMKQQGTSVSLYIADNGQGLPADFDMDNAKAGLGLRLMKGLAEDIEGTFRIYSHNGVHIEISFIANTPFQFVTTKHTDLSLA